MDSKLKIAMHDAYRKYAGDTEIDYDGPEWSNFYAGYIAAIATINMLTSAPTGGTIGMDLATGPDWTAEATYKDGKIVSVSTSAAAQPVALEPEWIVNDLGELGVRVAGRHFFLYKGDNIEYLDGLHSDGTPMLCRNVGKREFGETVSPWAWIKQGHSEARYRAELVYTPGLSFGPPDAPKYTWRPLSPTNQTKGS